MFRIEVYEKYTLPGQYTEEQWNDFMGLKGSPPSSGYGYRRTMPLIEQIERVIEIPGNRKECILRFWSGEDMTIRDNYDEFCIKLMDLEEEIELARYGEEDLPPQNL